jgi:hypothetical protein
MFATTQFTSAAGRLALRLGVVAALALATACSGAAEQHEAAPIEIGIDDNELDQYGRWSPDGRHFALLIDHVLVGGTVELADDNRRTITNTDLDVTAFAWMPDSQSLLVAYAEPRRVLGQSLDAPTHTPLAVVALDGTVTKRINVTPQLRVWYGISVRQDGAIATIGGGPPGPAGFDFDSSLWTIDLSTGDTSELPVNTNGPIFDPSYIDGEVVVAMVNGPDGIGGTDDNHLVAVNTTDSTTWRVTPTDDQVTAFSVRPCAGTVVYSSSGKLRGYGDLPVYERDLHGESPSHPVGRILAGDVFANPDGNDMYYTTYQVGRDGADVRYELQHLSGC